MMKRFLATMLTLALFIGLSSGNASAKDFFGISMANTTEGGSDGISGATIRFAATEVGIMDLIDLSWLGGQEGEDIVDKDTANIPLYAMDPGACPNLDGQEGTDAVDLWFELVDAGYTEDEAFELVEMVMGSGLGAARAGEFQAVVPEVRPQAYDEDCETYQDSNGGTITFCGDLGDDHGTYERKDGRGNLISKGTWNVDRNGDLTYQGDAGYDQESGSATNTPDGYEYQGTDVNGNREQGLWF